MAPSQGGASLSGARVVNTPLVSQDQVQAAGGAIRYLLSLRHENETVADFLMRHIDYERKRYLPAPIAEPAEPIIIDKPKRTRKAALADNETRNWPALQGQRYVGEWPPKGLVTLPPRATLPLDDNQRAWLERYSEKYPDACNPYQLLTVAEAKARDPRNLLEARYD